MPSKISKKYLIFGMGYGHQKFMLSLGSCKAFFDNRNKQKLVEKIRNGSNI